MRRILLPLPLLIAALMLWPSSASAAATCSNHALSINGFHQGGPTDAFYDFKCGGATNTDYHLYFLLQYKSKTGVWHDGVCDGGFPAHTCDRDDPSSGWNNGGSEQNVATSFQQDNDFTPICWPQADHMTKSWRVRMKVSFRNADPDLFWNSASAASGWCPV